MNIRTIAVAVLVCGLTGITANARAEIAVKDAWVRATISSGDTTAGYAIIENSGADADDLVSVSTPIAALTELHQSVGHDGMMRMEAVKGLTIPAHQKVMLKPAGYHLMIMKVTKPLKVGEMIDLLFTFEKHGPVKVSAKVAPLSAQHAP